MTKIVDTEKSPPFDHPRNITVGKARVIYALAVMGFSKPIHPEGWVLPGGRRTTDFAEAHAAAARMEGLTT